MSEMERRIEVHLTEWPDRIHYTAWWADRDGSGVEGDLVPLVSSEWSSRPRPLTNSQALDRALLDLLDLLGTVGGIQVVVPLATVAAAALEREFQRGVLTAQESGPLTEEELEPLR